VHYVTAVAWFTEDGQAEFVAHVDVKLTTTTAVTKIAQIAM